jgi:hypothetical protein
VIAFVVFLTLAGIAFVVGATRVRPNRTLSRPLGDATARRARLRLVMGGRP